MASKARTSAAGRATVPGCDPPDPSAKLQHGRAELTRSLARAGGGLLCGLLRPIRWLPEPRKRAARRQARRYIDGVAIRRRARG